MKWFAIIFIAIVIEGIVEYIKLSFPRLAESNAVIILTIALGIFIAVAYNADLMALAGLSSGVPYVGQVLTGVIVSRGSNYIYDLVGKYTEGEKWGRE